MSENAIVGSRVGPGAMLTDCVMNRSNVTSIENLHQTNIGQVTYETEKKSYCPSCGNEVGAINRRLVCNICGSNDICEVCSAYTPQYTEYREYAIDLGWPICRECYKEEIALARLEIDRGRVQRHMRRVEEDREETDRFAEYTVPAPSETPMRSVLENPEPIIRTHEDCAVGKFCAYIGITAGIVSIFVLGFILGPVAIALGIAAVLRADKKGVWAIGLGLLGVATSVFWVFVTGSVMWFL